MRNFKLFSFFMFVIGGIFFISCESSLQKTQTSSGNAALDNIFERKSVRTYLNKGVEKEKIDLMLLPEWLRLRERTYVPGNLS